ncbi:MAG: efflux RND transporter periplasmic adaptor subunit [Planctomycetota bacterium]
MNHIRSPRRLAAVVVLLLGWGAALRSAAQPPSDQPASVVAVPVQSRVAKTSYRLLGNVAPLRASTVGVALAGRVKKVHVRRGTHLAAGDVIAELQTSVIEIELAAAKAELRLYQQQFEELRAGSRQEDIAEAKARMIAAGAIAKRSESQLKRVQRLVTSRASSADEVDVATAEAESSKQLHAAAIIAHDRLVAGPRIEQIAQAQAQVDLQQEQVRLLEDRLVKHTLRAPFDGWVTTQYTEEGAWVTAGAPIVDLVELDTVEVELAVPAEQVVNLRPGQSIRAERTERPGELLVGQLDRIVPSADTRARTFPVLVAVKNRLQNGIPVLLSGMVVRVDLPVGKSEPSTFVPTDAIVLNRSSQSVFIVDLPTDAADTKQMVGIVRQVPVQLGIADQELIAVSGELSAEDLVVTRGNEGLRPGQEVSVTIQSDQDT